MISEPTGGWIMAVIATLLALWTYKLSKQHETTDKLVFERILFLGKHYMTLHDEASDFMLRLKTLLEKIQQGGIWHYLSSERTSSYSFTHR